MPVSLSPRKLVNANGSFGDEYLGENGEFNALVTLRPHEVLQLQQKTTDFVCGVVSGGRKMCLLLLGCSAHTLPEKLEVTRLRHLCWLVEEERMYPLWFARQRSLVKLLLDYQYFWRQANGEEEEEEELADLRSTTCSKESCDLLSKQNRVLLKRAFVSKILKHLGRKMADFVACLHLRLRGIQNESDRLHELRERLHHHLSPI